MPTAIYGSPPRDVIEPPAGAIQVSPLVPGSQDLAAIAQASLDEIAVLVPPGAVEARHVLAQALRALRPGGLLTAAAPKDKGGLRLKKVLAALGCEVAETARRHHRICTVTRPEDLAGLQAALAEGEPRQLADGLWSQPGIFSWDRLDPGSALLLAHLPALSGSGADFGCGVGWLARAVLTSPEVTDLVLIDLDRRAVEAARRNIDDSRAALQWTDVRQAASSLTGLDFVVMNPPFHDGGVEDRTLGQAFIRAAAGSLRSGGTLWITANRHLPYEAALKAAFKSVRPVADSGGYKVYEARR
ncbi:class I SAM-dependent methyltransferase [Phenylobacterium sp.]|uniref:class I SAM-dependent methyltransferase n=1 Tax=Phenylobacterium sp. TaxID=1871053 RepID=UPI002734B676|nr:class I SAM-dependent methyltransferase [Phenylobacterium sp.]MDP3852635.1 class I SAM-dependent methyltransferase [Phenylobacterium sp.]